MSRSTWPPTFIHCRLGPELSGHWLCIRMESFRQRIGQNYGELVPLGNSKVPTRRYREEFTAEPKTKIEASVDPGETAFGGSGISSKYWTFDGLRQQSKRFQPVKRISASLPNATLLHYLEEYEAHGKPLIIEDWHKHPNWPKDLFDIDRLLEHNGHQSEHHSFITIIC